MENVQRSVMLLKPDAHVAGQWRGGATLRLNAAPGGVALSLQGATNMSGGCVLTLFSHSGQPLAENELSGVSFQTRVSRVRLDDIAGAAVICNGSFLLKSSGLNWPEVIAQYRFSHSQPAAPTEPTEPLPEEVQSVPEESAPSVESQHAADENVQPPEVEDMAAETAPLSEPEPEEAPVAGEDEASVPEQQPEKACPSGIRQSPVDPFPGVFPGSEWVKISYPGPAGWWHYIFGRARVDGCDADVVGVPGDYSMTPPPWLDGFSTYVRCSSGDARGYWLMFQDAQTGQVLDTGRFRRGG